MGENTKIEWATHSLNFWEGCTKVSEGCQFCYAEARNARFGGGTAPNWGPGAPRRLTSVANWAQALKWNREAEASGIRPRVFVNSLADIFDAEVDPTWLAKALDVMRQCPFVDFLLVTKRPELWRERVQAAHDNMAGYGRAEACAWLSHWLDGEAPHNLWIGTTVENQKRADERIPALLKIPARVRFLSCEPLLGPVDLTSVRQEVSPGFFGDCLQWYHRGRVHEVEGTAYPTIHWVICGGESGREKGVRPMHPDWARSLRDQCAAAGVAFFFKQWGEWAPGVARLKRYDPANPKAYVNEVRWCSSGGTVGITEHTKQRNLTTPEREPHRFEDGEILTYRVGKSEAGRLLDGVEHNALPEVARCA